jgi:hypothetical protein
MTSVIHNFDVLFLAFIAKKVERFDMFKVAHRSGSKGAGKLFTHVATESDGKVVADYLKKQPGFTGDVLVSEVPVTVIETPEQFIARNVAESTKEARLAAFKAEIEASAKAKVAAGELTPAELAEILK